MVRQNRKEKLWFDCGRLHEDFRWELTETLGLPCSSRPSVSEKYSRGQRQVWQVHAVEIVDIEALYQTPGWLAFHVIRLGLPQG